MSRTYDDEEDRFLKALSEAVDDWDDDELDETGMVE